jgi:hypothetical protein
MPRDVIFKLVHHQCIPAIGLGKPGGCGESFTFQVLRFSKFQIAIRKLHNGSIKKDSFFLFRHWLFSSAYRYMIQTYNRLHQ